MGMIDMNSIKQLFQCKPLRNIFDEIYVVDLISRSCEGLATADLDTLNTWSYDNWLISFAEKMFKSDSVEFFLQMNLKRICASLTEETPRYSVYCRMVEYTCIQEYQLNICYLDERRTQLIIFREEFSRERPRPLETIDELSHCNMRFRFLVNHLSEDFIEVNIKTGECHAFPADNRMQTCIMYKEQIAWWAKNIIVPEEREAYIKEYELENLTRKLRENDGYHSASFTAFSETTRNDLLIISTLVEENFGARQEYIFAYAQDITQIKVQETRNKQLVDISQQLLILSQTEPVTGLFNRAACEKLIGECLAAAADAVSGTMLLIDIDYFKAFNDQYGHSTGDFVLKFLGKTLQDIFRSDDIICRWGGDEFVVFMRHICDKKTIISRIERLRAKLRQCKKEEYPLPITVSIGGEIATSEMTMKILFDHCDKSLYKVKAQGRNNYFIYSD